MFPEQNTRKENTCNTCKIKHPGDNTNDQGQTPQNTHVVGDP